MLAAVSTLGGLVTIDSTPQEVPWSVPLDQDAKLKLIPHLIKSWELAPDGLSMAVELRLQHPNLRQVRPAQVGTIQVGADQDGPG